MFNPLGLKKLNILENISLNAAKSSELSLKVGMKPERMNYVLQATDASTSSNENKSVSSRSSQSEFSDVVKLNGPPTQGSLLPKKNEETQSVLESKPFVALFIGDLSKQVTEEDLKSIFGKFKSLVSVKVCTDFETGESLGHGYLNFRRREDTLAAIDEFNYRPIFDKEVRIMPSLRNSLYRKNMGTNVFFSNLPLENRELTTRVFYDTFKVYGNILSCKLDKRKNIGFVYFDNDHAARIVIREFNGQEFFGNKIVCGIHFDKDVRKFPEFEKRKTSLNEITLLKEDLTSGPNDKNVVQHNSASQIPHPNAIFVKNLPFNCTDDEILDFFSNVGPVKSVFSSAAAKYKSLWAFVTYKKGSDTKRAIKFYNGAHFKGRKLNINKAEPKGKNMSHKRPNGTQYKPTLCLHNLSSICNEQFLAEMCMQERIKIEGLAIIAFYEETSTYSGYVKCKNKNGANKIFELLNNRLIGGCIVKVTWGSPKTPNGAIPVSTLAPLDVRHAHSHTHGGLPGQHSLPEAIHGSSPAFSLPVYAPLYYHAHAMAIAQKGSPTTGACGDRWKLTPDVKYQLQRNDQQMQQVLEYLKRQVKKGVDFLRYPTATREENLRSMTEYIFEVHWQKDLNKLTNFLLLMSTNTQNESALNRQIEEAAKYLGFER